jgi:succinoglycan biosynthesis transport protein ExoP
MNEVRGSDVRAYLQVARRWKWLLLAFVVALPVGAYLIERGKPKIYQSSALVGVNQTTVNTALLGSSSGTFSTSNVTAIAELVTTTPVAQVAADLMHPPGVASQIVKEITAKGDPATNFLTLTVQDQSPYRAAEIANSFAKAVSLNLRHSAVQQINNSIKGVRAQLARVNTANAPPGSTAAQLEQQLNQLRAARSTQGSEAAILQVATPNTTPIGPHVQRTVELALLIGLLLGLGAVVLAENADRRLRTPDDLEQMVGEQLLATIPPSAFSSKLDTGPADEEAFQMLRTALMYFSTNRGHRSIVITSPGEKDGKTTVATRLALSAARAGLRVVLVDADLRRAQIGARLGIETDEGLGVALAHKRPVSELLVTCEIDEAGAGELKVLPAGLSPANPAALVSSPQMGLVLGELLAEADLVLIDTPAALMVSDPLPLMELASGVILVARVNRSTREKIGRLKKMIEAAHGTLLGVVATGTGSGAGYGYYGSRYYSRNGHDKVRERTNGGMPEAAVASPGAPPEGPEHDTE